MFKFWHLGGNRLLLLAKNAVMKKCQKFGKSPPSLIWTKSKRTAVFTRDTFPKLNIHTLPIYASFRISNTCYLDFVHLHKIDLQSNFSTIQLLLFVPLIPQLISLHHDITAKA